MKPKSTEQVGGELDWAVATRPKNGALAKKFKLPHF